MQNIFITSITQCIANILTDDDVVLQYKAIEIHQEWDKAVDENWSHTNIFQYGYILTLVLKKEVYFCQKTISNALLMCW